jgi:hypothetical protein
MPLFHAEDLDVLLGFNLDRQDPEPRAISLRVDCHPEAATWPIYDGEREAILVTCGACGREYMAIAVARQPQGPSTAGGGRHNGRP